MTTQELTAYNRANGTYLRRDGLNCFTLIYQQRPVLSIVRYGTWWRMEPAELLSVAVEGEDLSASMEVNMPEMYQAALQWFGDLHAVCRCDCTDLEIRDETVEVLTEAGREHKI